MNTHAVSETADVTAGLRPISEDTLLRRDCTGQTLHRDGVDTRWARVEIQQRRTPGTVEVQFKQQRPTLCWFRRGISSARLKFETEEFAIDMRGEANLLLYPARCDVAGDFRTADMTESAFVFFDPVLIQEQLGFDFDRPVPSISHAGLRRTFSTLCRELKTADGVFNLFAEGCAMQMLAQLARLYRPDAKGRKSVLQGLAVWQVRRVIAYMRDHLDRNISLDDLANEVGLSRFYFCTAFRLSTGRTPYEMVLELRMRRARELLTLQNGPITEIALMVGYQTPSAFAATFRRFVGVTPREYRQQRN